MPKSVFSHKKAISFLLLLLVCFFIWLAAQIPYAHDDWDWGIDIGMEQLLHATVNSRYAGNLLEVILTRSELAKCLIMGLTFFALPIAAVLVAAYSPGKDSKIISPALLGLSYVLFLLIDVNMWRETNGWVAGFANYSFSALLLAVFIRQLQNTFSPEYSGNAGIGSTVFVFFTAFILQMYLENLTIYILFVSTVLFIFSLCRKRGVHRCAAALGGAVLGTVIMFSSNIYNSLLSSGQAVDEYRQLTFRMSAGLLNVAISIARNLAARIIPPLYIGCNTHCIVLLIGLLILLRFSKSLPCHRRRFYVISDTFCFCIFALEFLNLSGRLDAVNHHAAVAILTLFSAFFAVIVLMQLYDLLPIDNSDRLWSIFFWVSAPLIVVPMSAVNTVGERTFYTPLFLISLVILAVFKRLLELGSEKFRRHSAIAIVSVMLAMCVHYAVIYGAIGQVKQARSEIITSSLESNASEIVLPNYPHNRYLHGANPVGEEKDGLFQRFLRYTARCCRPFCGFRAERTIRQLDIIKRCSLTCKSIRDSALFYNTLI